MLQELSGAIALVGAIIAARIYYKKVMTNGTKKQKFIAKAKKNGHYTTAEYVSHKRYIGNPLAEDYDRRCDSEHVKYEYRVNGIAYCKELRFKEIGSVSINFPDSITVYYDPRNPKKSVCPEEASQYQQKQNGCLGSVAVGFAVMMMLLLILKFLLRW